MSEHSVTHTNDLAEQELSDWLSAVSSLARDDSAELERLRHELNGITHSLSWKLTSPLRWATKTLRGVKRRLRATKA